jgi:hypothetical protein
MVSAMVWGSVLSPDRPSAVSARFRLTCCNHDLFSGSPAGPTEMGFRGSRVQIPPSRYSNAMPGNGLRGRALLHLSAPIAARKHCGSTAPDVAVGSAGSGCQRVGASESRNFPHGECDRIRLGRGVEPRASTRWPLAQRTRVLEQPVCRSAGVRTDRPRCHGVRFTIFSSASDVRGSPPDLDRHRSELQPIYDGRCPIWTGSHGGSEVRGPEVKR